MIVRRGRPAGSKNPTNTIDAELNGSNFTKIDTDGLFRRKFYRDGILSTVWTFNPKLSMVNPISIEVADENGDLAPTVEDTVDMGEKKSKSAKYSGIDLINNMDIPKTKRMYIHPTNGKTIGYTRARMLGLID